jgi:inosine-uridine nucleoside N-ribohydrolase
MKPVMLTLLTLALWVCPALSSPAAPPGTQHTTPSQPPAPVHKTPVILDTDIGDDIDDTWALGLLLQCPELDLKLVLTDYGRPLYRARLAAKLLQTMGRPDVPIGLGIDVPNVGGAESQAAWLGDYDLATYPGPVHTNGIRALIETILQSPQPVTLIAIGPLPNIAAALTQEPRIARRARFIGMHGSVRRGYGGKNSPDAEWNVRCDPRAAQQVLAAPWDITLTPLDTCGLVQLDGPRFAQLRTSNHPIPRTILENYRVWAARRPELAPRDIEQRSSTLFDCVAIYLAVSRDLCEMETLPLTVTSDGFTRIDPTGRPVQVATAWKDLDAFKDWLTHRLSPNPTSQTRTQ